ncbi:VF530 family DNA-binding protein [Herminiimonas sp. CN]|uniref:VF530 family protein n=1 Tax=Herminiimonas sp. CN TaxID=1349818 RepID=UPI00047426EB|nr:VF530 family protein [Herminiimonas sp. CN]
MSTPQSNNPLQGVTLEALLTALVSEYGWDGLARMVDVRCFKSEPSIKSSLTFLRKTPWARSRVEQIYVSLRQQP